MKLLKALFGMSTVCKHRVFIYILQILRAYFSFPQTDIGLLLCSWEQLEKGTSKPAPKLVTNITGLENMFKSDLFASIAKTWLNADRFRLTMLKNCQSEDSNRGESSSVHVQWFLNLLVSRFKDK